MASLRWIARRRGLKRAERRSGAGRRRPMDQRHRRSTLSSSLWWITGSVSCPTTDVSKLCKRPVSRRSRKSVSHRMGWQDWSGRRKDPVDRQRSTAADNVSPGGKPESNPRSRSAYLDRNSRATAVRRLRRSQGLLVGAFGCGSGMQDRCLTASQAVLHGMVFAG